jgi:thiamine-phosphate pyrophosphorylase
MTQRAQLFGKGDTAEEQLRGIETVLHGGCKWIQLRFKNATLTDIQNLGTEVKSLCKIFNATFIINDHILLAQELDADGVHLGLEDSPVEEARKTLGPDKIIGGTANTWEHVQKRVAEKVDYIGLGPLRFTPTKKELSPILGVAGYEAILSEQNRTGDRTPIFAIGGVTAEDIPALMDAGIYGVAVSSALLQGNDAGTIIQNFNEKLHATVKHSR